VFFAKIIWCIAESQVIVITSNQYAQEYDNIDFALIVYEYRYVFSDDSIIVVSELLLDNVIGWEMIKQDC